MKVVPLYEGSYSVDKSKKFIPFDPEVHNPKDRPASLFVYVQPFLVETSAGLLVFDTGLGYKNDEGKLIIHENIRKAGYDPEDVSMVLMSHLHFDHAAGMIFDNNGSMQLTFPNAEYVINRNEWETAYSSHSSSYHTDIFDVVQRSGSIHFIEGNGQLNERISYEVTGGHCPFHQVFLINDGGEKAFYGGDILPEPEQLLRRFKAKYDFDGARSMELREEFGKLAAKENWLCLFYHAKSEPMGRVELKDDAFRIRGEL
ncbi:glyoxylase-like metal-dependent hydrolase (beta-lactamase superfamily II) [Arcticibacter tournemirensis]|uniref:MBL fold metallo-hydrolase n=1 Tax=Arcticibacter tournemirensis TaxID=699437 RepID=UPI00116E4CC6|nr:MBL fold metallo-hydrolase [Arcticibacter tournemirensis]TQM52575.1 glyoxylase-like metal-dependent hydrolase (beta-lactamase superfamily II) [Arcticibacter tournemirensis]